MKANSLLIVILLCFVIVKKGAAQLSLKTTGAVVINFQSTVDGVNEGTFTGAGIDASPSAGQLDDDGVSFNGITTLDGGTVASSAVPPSDALFAVTDGGNTWLGISPVGNWSIVLKINNDIVPATPFYSLDIDVDVRIWNSDLNNQTYALEFALSEAGPWMPIGSPIALPLFGADISPNWQGTVINQGVVCMGNIASGSSVFLRISGSGPGTDHIAFNSLSITPITGSLCTLTNLTSFSASNVLDNTLDLTWMEDGSGDCPETYLVVGREGVAPASDLVVANLQGLYDATDFTVNTDWSTRGESNEVFNQTGNTLGADGIDYFVYKGTGTSTTISGLDQNTNYNFLLMAVGEQCAWLVDDNINTMTLLPIELSSFQGQARQNDILLSWTTKSEQNNSHMIVERSTDGQHFQAIGQVEGAGTSLTSKEYSFIDTHPSSGKNYYRLKQVDFDGAVDYSEIIVIDFKNAAFSWEVTPNIIEDQLSIRSTLPFERGEFFRIVSINGNILKTVQVQEEAFGQEVDISDLPAGFYFIQYSGKSKDTTKKVLKR